MTTYELPPEPPIGESVKDKHGRVWKHIGVNNWTANPDSVLITDSRPWLTLLASSPLTLIEPDPWPTAPLIVADWTSGGQQGGRGLLYRETDADQYWSIIENESVYPEHTGDALTNVVPVTVVPTERVDYLSAAHASWVAGAIDDKTMIGYAIGLLESLDELRVDL